MAVALREVIIDDETYSLDTIPQAGSQLVARAREDLLGEINLEAFAADLRNLGMFIRVAYNGVAGNTELQIKVQRVGYEITELADKSALTIHSYKVTSRDVLGKMKGTYQYLLEGLEEMALITLSQLSIEAQKMEMEAKELHDKFQTATQNVKSALEKTQKTKGKQTKRQEEMEKQQADFERQRQKAEKEKEQAMEDEEKAEQWYADAQKREDKAYDDLELQNSSLRELTEAFGKVILSVGVVTGTAPWAATAILAADKIANYMTETADHNESIKIANAEKMKQDEERKKQREKRRQAELQFIEFTERIKNCKDDESLAQVAVEALHESVGALKNLSAIMMEAAKFWGQMQKHCKALASEEIKKKVDIALRLGEERRIKVWSSETFKQDAIKFYAKWVALDDVCGRYMKQIEGARSDLYACLRENPTTEESRDNVRKLAADFHKELKQKQDDDAKKNRAALQEITNS